jgi:hypothetical protein
MDNIWQFACNFHSRKGKSNLMVHFVPSCSSLSVMFPTSSHSCESQSRFVDCPADGESKMYQRVSTSTPVFSWSTIFLLFDNTQHTMPKTVGCHWKSVSFPHSFIQATCLTQFSDSLQSATISLNLDWTERVVPRCLWLHFSEPTIKVVERFSQYLQFNAHLYPSYQFIWTVCR